LLLLLLLLFAGVVVSLFVEFEFLRSSTACVAAFAPVAMAPAVALATEDAIDVAIARAAFFFVGSCGNANDDVDDEVLMLLVMLLLMFPPDQLWFLAAAGVTGSVQLSPS
jgi:hypothetical protein